MRGGARLAGWRPLDWRVRRRWGAWMHLTWQALPPLHRRPLALSDVRPKQTCMNRSPTCRRRRLDFRTASAARPQLLLDEVWDQRGQPPLSISAWRWAKNRLWIR